MLVDACGNRHILDVRLAGIDRHRLIQKSLLAGHQRDTRRRTCRGGVEPNLRDAVVHVKIHRCFDVGLLHSADVAEGVPAHGERAAFIRLQPAIVGLVVGIGTDHEFDVRAIVIGEGFVPRAATRTLAPGEELLAGNHVVVGDAHCTGLFAVIVPGEEIVVVIPREDRRGVEMVLQHADVHRLAGFARHIRERPLLEDPLRMSGAILRAGRENHLVIVIGVHRHVGKAQHRVDLGSAVDNPQRGLQI